MSTVVEIETALQTLPIEEARTVSMWLIDYLEEQWDQRIDRDIDSGKLDKLAAKALEQYQLGKVRPLDEVMDHS
jgi:hypothetical protein